MNTACVDCDKYHYETFDYMVLDNVWESAKLNPRDKCCIGCLSKRLGRNLCAADFTGARINLKIFDLVNHYDKT